MEQLLLNIHPSPQKTLDNFVVGKNAECINSIKKLLSSTNLFFKFYHCQLGYKRFYHQKI